MTRAEGLDGEVRAWRDSLGLGPQQHLVTDERLRSSNAWTLVTFAESALEPLELSDDTRAFLSTVGLPRRVDPEWTLTAPGGRLRRYSLPDGAEQAPPRYALGRWASDDSEQFPLTIVVDAGGVIHKHSAGEDGPMLEEIADSVRAFSTLLLVMSEARALMTSTPGRRREICDVARQLVDHVGTTAAEWFWHPDLWLP
jgi:hypothetical protein